MQVVQQVALSSRNYETDVHTPQVSTMDCLCIPFYWLLVEVDDVFSLLCSYDMVRCIRIQEGARLILRLDFGKMTAYEVSPESLPAIAQN